LAATFAASRLHLQNSTKGDGAGSADLPSACCDTVRERFKPLANRRSAVLSRRALTFLAMTNALDFS
jgi:hypothetical protein